jgi:hypothetical protein
MFYDVLAFHDRFTVCVGAGVAVPVSVSVVVAGLALLVKVSVPLAAPDTCGLKVTVNEYLTSLLTALANAASKKDVAEEVKAA